MFLAQAKGWPLDLDTNNTVTNIQHKVEKTKNTYSLVLESCRCPGKEKVMYYLCKNM